MSLRLGKSTHSVRLLSGRRDISSFPLIGFDGTGRVAAVMSSYDGTGTTSLSNYVHFSDHMETSSHLTIASFPGVFHLQFLIACSKNGS